MNSFHQFIINLVTGDTGCVCGVEYIHTYIHPYISFTGDIWCVCGVEYIHTYILSYPLRMEAHGSCAEKKKTDTTSLPSDRKDRSREFVFEYASVCVQTGVYVRKIKFQIASAHL